MVKYHVTWTFQLSVEQAADNIYFVSSFEHHREGATVNSPQGDGRPCSESGLRGGECKLATCMLTRIGPRQAMASCLDHLERKSADCRRILTLRKTLSLAPMTTSLS